MDLNAHYFLVKVVKVVDGDTVDVDIDLGFQQWIHKERIRLSGIDCPESRTSDDVEKKYGLLAKDFVADFLTTDSDIYLHTLEKGKYGRYLGDFFVDGKWLTARLLDEHHAVKYNGENKNLMKEAHLANRKALDNEQ